jgi:DNA-directed RNA polymerase subunit RPC12/RpoP
MKELYECGSCGAITGASEHLCDPRPVESRRDYCGSSPESAEMCDTMKKTAEYECGTCGRPVESAGLACNPIKTR